MDELTGLLTLLAIALILVMLGGAAMIVHHARHPPRHTAGYAVARGLPIDPGEAGMAFEQWTLDRPDGARLPVWEMEGKARRSSARQDAKELPRPRHQGTEARRVGGAEPRAELVGVLVHGWGQSRIDMLARLAPWGDCFDGLVLYDRRGHGEAAGGSSRLGHREDEDLVALLERLHEPDGPARRFVLVGYSMGAVIAMAVAAVPSRVRDRVAGIVAHGPYTDFRSSLHGRLRSWQMPAWPMTDLARAWLWMTGIRPPGAARLAGGLSCPLLIVQGQVDPVCPPARAERLADLASDGELVIVAGAGHLDAHRIDADAVARPVAAFVDRVRSGAPGAPGA